MVKKRLKEIRRYVMKRRLAEKTLAAVLSAAVIFSTTAVPAFADITSAVEGSEGTAVSVSTTTESGVTVADSSGTATTLTTGSGVVVSGIDSAVEGQTGTTSSTSAGSSGVTGPGAGDSMSNSASVGNVVIAGTSSVSSVQTEGEKNAVNADILGGATLTMFNSQSDSQILSCMIQTNDGSLIVIDGGFGEDADYLTSQIQARGGRVSAWLVTHPHGDHAGALYRILQNADSRYAAGEDPLITIDAIYYSMADADWYRTNDPDECTMAIALLGAFESHPTLLHTVGRGDTFQIDTATVQVLNDRYEATSDKGNNAGIVYKVTVNGVSILFLGDLSQAGGAYLLQVASPAELKSDIVQMAHHGQNGVGQEFYQAVSPSICLWPTPSWLWVSQESKYTIQTTKQWMIQLGVQKHYCMKDGDQVIR